MPERPSRPRRSRSTGLRPRDSRRGSSLRTVAGSTGCRPVPGRRPPGAPGLLESARKRERWLFNRASLAASVPRDRQISAYERMSLIGIPVLRNMATPASHSRSWATPRPGARIRGGPGGGGGGDGIPLWRARSLRGGGQSNVWWRAVRLWADRRGGPNMLFGPPRWSCRVSRWLQDTDTVHQREDGAEGDVDEVHEYSLFHPLSQPAS